MSQPNGNPKFQRERERVTLIGVVVVVGLESEPELHARAWRLGEASKLGG